MQRFNSEDRICILRSAFIGDWITTIPFYLHLIYDCNIKKENIYTIIINNENFNPVEKIFGNDSVLFLNSSVINNKTIKTSVHSSLKIRKELNGKINKIVYLSFSEEPRLSVLKKFFISFVFASSNINRLGFKYNKKTNYEINKSQYVSYFEKLGINFQYKISYGRDFLETESIIIKQKDETDKKIIALYPHSKLQMKIWPLKNFIALIELLNNRYDAKFFLIGGKEDYEYNELVLSGVSNGIVIENIAGQFSVKQTFVELSKVDLIISNDGAPMHIASLLNLPIVGLFTYKEEIGVWDPYLSNSYITLRNEVLCKNCFKNNCPNPVCLKLIDVESVWNSCVELLDNPGKIIRVNKVLIPQISINFKNFFSEK